jgi:hypothetical protein
VADDAIGRKEFEGYTQRHEADRFAHAAMRHEFRNELVITSVHTEKRLTVLERWQQRIIGALGLLSLSLVVGVPILVIELTRR